MENGTLPRKESLSNPLNSSLKKFIKGLAVKDWIHLPLNSTMEKSRVSRIYRKSS